MEGLETTIRDPGIRSAVANVTFRDLTKTAILSNDLRVNLDLAAEGAALTTAEDATEIGDGAALGESKVRIQARDQIKKKAKLILQNRVEK